MKIYHIFFFILLAGLWSCAPGTSTSMAPQQPGQYKTYAWLKGDQKAENPLYNSEIIDQNIRQSVDRELSAKGFTIDTQNPDFLVKYQTYTEKRVSTTGGYYGGWPNMGFGPYSRWGWGYGYGYGSMMGSSPSTYTTTEGTLVIDFIDTKSGNVVWRGYAEGNVDNASRLSPKIEKGVHSIMKKLPLTASAS